jgi:hypothetical protein
MTYLTTKRLKSLGACVDQIKLFRQLFGDRAYINEWNLMIAIRHGLHIDWLLPKLGLGRLIGRIDYNFDDDTCCCIEHLFLRIRREQEFSLVQKKYIDDLVEALRNCK